MMISIVEEISQNDARYHRFSVSGFMFFFVIFFCLYKEHQVGNERRNIRTSMHGIEPCFGMFLI